MAIVTAYDSGLGSPLTPGPWQEFLLSSVPSPNPLHVGLRIDLVSAPAPTWHTLGYVSMRLVAQGVLYSQPAEIVPLIESEEDVPAGYEWASREVLVPKAVGRDIGAREVQLRGVSWTVHRWLGPYRARVVYAN